jgi:hypothetical protein
VAAGHCNSRSLLDALYPRRSLLDVLYSTLFQQSSAFYGRESGTHALYSTFSKPNVRYPTLFTPHSFSTTPAVYSAPRSLHHIRLARCMALRAQDHVTPRSLPNVHYLPTFFTPRSLPHIRSGLDVSQLTLSTQRSLPPDVLYSTFFTPHSFEGSVLRQDLLSQTHDHYAHNRFPVSWAETWSPGSPPTLVPYPTFITRRSLLHDHYPHNRFPVSWAETWSPGSPPTLVPYPTFITRRSLLHDLYPTIVVQRLGQDLVLNTFFIRPSLHYQSFITPHSFTSLFGQELVFCGGCHHLPLITPRSLPRNRSPASWARPGLQFVLYSTFFSGSFDLNDPYPTFFQHSESSSMARTRLSWAPNTPFVHPRSLPNPHTTITLFYGSWEGVSVHSRSLHQHSFPGSLGKDLSSLRHLPFFTPHSFSTPHTLSSSRLGNGSSFTCVFILLIHFSCYQSLQITFGRPSGSWLLYRLMPWRRRILGLLGATTCVF